MSNRIFSAIIMCLVVLGTIGLVFDVQPVRASGTIYIRVDGSIDPPTAPVLREGNVFTLTGNIFNSSIIVEKENVVIDGAGHALEGTGEGTGFGTGISIPAANVTIKNMEIRECVDGISVRVSNAGINCSILGNNITNNREGIVVIGSDVTISGNDISYNYCYGIDFGMGTRGSIFGNRITNNGKIADYDTGGIYIAADNVSVTGNDISKNVGAGIRVEPGNHNIIYGNRIEQNLDGGVYVSAWVGNIVYSENNVIVGNDIIGNGADGIYLFMALNTSVYHNNFADNSVQIDSAASSALWDDGYPSGGNYWSDYNGTDVLFGPYQNLTGSDGIGDTPYSLVDNYPVMSPYQYWSSPILGDVNRDMKVSMGDIGQLFDAIGSTNGTDGYYWHSPPCIACPHNPNCDIDSNGRIDRGDINCALDNFGKQRARYFLNFMSTEQGQITNLEFTACPRCTIVKATFKNTGSNPITIDEVWVNNATLTDYSWDSTMPIEANTEAVCTIPMTVVSGGRYEFKMVSSKGNTFIRTQTAPT